MARRRQHKPRLSRLDAAVDAMARLGFAAATVKKTVKALLREYGGDDSWPFIEDDSYKELIEAMLREQEKDGDREIVQDGLCSEEYGGDDSWPFIEDDSYKELIEAMLREQEKDGDREIVQDGLCSEVKCIDNGAGTSSGVLDACQHDVLVDTAPVDIGLHCGEVSETTNLEPVHNSSDHRSEDAKKTLSISENGNTVVVETAVATPGPSSNAPEDIEVSSGAIARRTNRRAPNHSSVKNGWEHIFINYPSKKRGTTGISRQNTKNEGTELLHNGNKSPIPSPLPNSPTPLPTDTRGTQTRTPCYGWIESDEDNDASDFIFLEPLPGKLGAKVASSPKHTKKVTFATEPKIIRKSRWDVKPNE